VFFLFVGAALILAIGLGAAAYATTQVVQAQGAERGVQTGMAQGRFEAGFSGRDGAAFDEQGPGGPGMHGDDTYLAEALGITVEELQAAQATAWSNAIDQALEQGLITEAQAAMLKENSAPDQAPQGGRGGRHGGGFFGGLIGPDSGIDQEALLAEALGISVEELQTARQEAADLAIQARIDSGELTAEQAELLKARQAIHDYIDREALTAAALGMTVEELQAAHEAGTDLPALIEEKGLTEEEFQAALQSAYESAVQQAVEDGVITQAQADLLLSSDAGMPFGGSHGFDDGGRGKGGRGKGGPGQFGPDGDCPPAAQETPAAGDGL
jgi:hypothetical protein